MDNVSTWEIGFSILVLIIGFAVKWAVKAKWSGVYEDELFTAISGSAQRVKDKFLAEIALARAEDSDGGAEVTAAELSEARAKALAMVYESLKGPALDYAKGRGAELVKGLIGGTLDKILDKAGIKVKK